MPDMPEYAELEKRIKTLETQAESDRLSIDALTHHKLLSERIIASTHALIVGLDRDHRIRMFNEGAEWITGYGRDEVMGEDWFRIFIKAEITDEIARVWEAAWGQPAHGYINPIRCRDGRDRIISWQSTGLYEGDDPARHLLISIGEDITERERAEADLRESEAKLKLILDGIGDLIAYVDADLRFVFVNKAYADWYGQLREYIVGKRVRDILPRPVFENALPRYQEALAGRKVCFENRGIDAAGRERYVRVQLIPHFRGTAVVGFFGSIMDITERKRSEEERTRLEAMNRQIQKTESLSRMAGAIAHRFNNHLAAVMGNIELAMDGLPTGGPAERLNAALKAVSQASDLSGMILTYLGKSTGKREPMDLSSFCRQCLPAITETLPDSVAFMTDLPDPGPVIRTDPSQMRQVLTHLVINARESVSGDGAVIRLCVRTVSPAGIPGIHRFPIDWHPLDRTHACLEVADTGPGIPEPDIEKIFDPFFSTKFTGRGLGLPVVLGIAQVNRGGVTVESGQGQGSVFRFCIPVSAETIPLRAEAKPRAAARAAAPAAKPSNETTGGLVLLVDDEGTVRGVAQAMLTRLGYAVISARDGVEAVAIFSEKKEEIRLVISDLSMPRMNGWETLSALRRISPDVRVILASGYDEARVRDGSHPESPQAFLSKPYLMSQLREAISRAQGRDDQAVSGPFLTHE